MKILVTGYNGFVAGSIIAQAPKKRELHATGRSALSEDTGRVTYHQADIVDRSAMEILFRQVRPDSVIHTAAMANIDLCENNQALAESVNVGGTEILASLCQETGAKLVFCSTDSIFDGKEGLYTEEDLPIPINYYASTKVRAEQIVLNANDINVVARLSLVMGLPVMGKGNSFLADLVGKLQKKEPVKFPANEIRTPVDVITLGSALLELAEGGFGGIIHLAGNTRINRYEMGRKIAAFGGFPEELILSVDSNSLPGRAPRPNDASLSNERAKGILRTPMLSLEEALALIFKN
ncbi:SDR family oxidoreductase [Flavitalea flava]